MRFSRLLLLSLLVISLLPSTPLAAQEEGEIQLELFSFKLSDLRITNTDAGLRVDYSWSLSVPQGNFVLPDSSLTLTLWTVQEFTGDPLNPQFGTRNFGSISSLTDVDFLISGAKSGTAGACDQLLSNDGFMVVVDISSNGVKNNQQISIPTQTYNVQLRRNSEVDCQTSKDSNEPVLIQAGGLEQPLVIEEFSLKVSDVKLQVIKAASGGQQLVNLGILGFDLEAKSMDANVFITDAAIGFELSGVDYSGSPVSDNLATFDLIPNEFQESPGLTRDEHGSIVEEFPLYVLNSQADFSGFQTPTIRGTGFRRCELSPFEEQINLEDKNLPPSISVIVQLELVRREQIANEFGYRLSFANITLNPTFEIEGSCK